jgi:hypothetical protein
MNRYGQMALDHTRQHRPTAFASLTDPTAHFSQLGEEIATRISWLRDELLGTPRPGENPEAYRQRSYQARRQAEEVVLAETVWLPPEDPNGPADDQTLAYRSRLSTIAQTLAGADATWTHTPPAVPHT